MDKILEVDPENLTATVQRGLLSRLYVMPLPLMVSFILQIRER